MLGVVENAVRIERPVPASRSFKAEKCASWEVGGRSSLLSLGREFYAVLGQDTLHFFKVSLAVVAEIFAYILGCCSDKHCKHSLTALQVCRFVDIVYVHSSLFSSLAVFDAFILNTNKIQKKICAEIQYKPVFNIKLLQQLRDCRLDFFQILNGV